jgi:hypothetical protein
MTPLPPREARVAALRREIEPLIGEGGALADAIDDLVAAAVDAPGAPALEAAAAWLRTLAPPAQGSSWRDLARDHLLVFAQLLPLDEPALALAAGLGPASRYRRFQEPRAVTREEAAAWERLEVGLEPVMDRMVGAMAPRP